MHHFLKLILFWNNILHVTDSLSVHHQEFQAVTTATGICQTGTVADYTDLTPDDGRKDRPKHVECYSKIKLV